MVADTESSLRPDPSCRTFLAEAHQNNRPICPRLELSLPLTPTVPPLVRMVNRSPPSRKPLHKRKRTLYRRFLVSLEARRRTPTSRSRRRRESRHDALWDGGSSSTDLRKPQHSLRRTDH